MTPYSLKSRAGALALAWLLGLFGAHRFYVGRHGSAIAMLIISCTVIGLLITGIWVLVDFIMIACGSFKDGDGKLIKHW